MTGTHTRAYEAVASSAAESCASLVSAVTSTMAGWLAAGNSRPVAGDRTAIAGGRLPA